MLKNTLTINGTREEINIFKELNRYYRDVSVLTFDQIESLSEKKNTIQLDDAQMFLIAARQETYFQKLLQAILEKDNFTTKAAHLDLFNELIDSNFAITLKTKSETIVLTGVVNTEQEYSHYVKCVQEGSFENEQEVNDIFETDVKTKVIKL